MKSARGKAAKVSRSTPAATVAPESDFVARHGMALVALVWCVLRAWQWAFVSVSPQQDVTAYFNHASQWLHGMTPYVDFAVEYPPGALPVWWVPRLVADNFESYRKAFAAWMLLFDGLTVMLLWRAAKGSARVVACTLYVVGTTMLGSLLLQRYDAVLGFLLMAWWTCAQQTRSRKFADVLLAVGIWVKLMAVLVLPVYWLHMMALDTLAARRGGMPWHKAILAWLPREGARRVATLVGATVLLFVPFYVQAGDKLWSFFTYHRDRGVQIETTWASVFLLARTFFGAPVTVDAQFGAIEVIHPWTATCATVAGVVTALALAATALTFGARLFHNSDEAQASGVALDGAVAMLLAFFACNKVLSPQYLLWLAPLAALCTQRGGWRLAGMAAVFVGTGLNWLFYYPQLFAMERWPIVVMAWRNVATVLVWVVLVAPFAKRLSFKHPAFTWAERHMTALALAMVGAWVVLLNISVTPADDVWLRLHEGAHVLARNGLAGFGTASSANATAVHVPRAWLSGVVLQGIVRTFGENAVAIFAALLAAAWTWMLARTPARNMHSAARVATLAVAAYVVSLRALNWPDALGLLAAASIVVCIENFAHTDKPAWLVALPVVQLAWINADAHAVFAPAWVLALAGAAAIEGTKLKRGMHIAWAAGGMALTTLVNPDGTAVLQHAALGQANPYARTWMWQWTSTFSESVFFYWPWLFIGLLCVTAVGLVLRASERPVCDAVALCIASLLAYQAGVFASVAAIVLWPACARSVDACVERFKLPVQGRGAGGVVLAAALLLVCNAVTYGYGVSDAEHRPPLRLGFGGDLPYAAAQQLRDDQVQGTVFNEFSDGGLLMATLSPRLKPVIDSRLESFSQEALQAYQMAYTQPQAFVAYAEDHHVTAALLYRGRAAPQVLAYLDGADGWDKVQDVQNRVLYVRRGAQARADLSAN